MTLDRKFAMEGAGEGLLKILEKRGDHYIISLKYCEDGEGGLKIVQKKV